MTVDTLYFDGNCGYCKQRASRLQQLARQGLEIVDINKLDSTVDIPGPLALKRELHLRTHSGQWLTGLDAALRAWSYTPFGPLFSILSLPGINALASAGFDLVSLKRYRRLYGCEACEE